MPSWMVISTPKLYWNRQARNPCRTWWLVVRDGLEEGTRPRKGASDIGCRLNESIHHKLGMPER